ncbi:MAG TPA: hypothetical protein VFZ77_15505 [Acidimicrobiales bacterium]
MTGRVGAMVLAAALAGGCGSGGGPGDGDGDGGAVLPAAVECGAQYRPDAEQLAGAEDATLRVERGDGAAGGSGTLAFDLMTLQVTYRGEAPEGRTVDLVVTTAAGEPLARTLYQVGGTALREVGFAGGHGFTGLHYVDHGGAQLQVWCTAAD